MIVVRVQVEELFTFVSELLETVDFYRFLFYIMRQIREVGKDIHRNLLKQN